MLDRFITASCRQGKAGLIYNFMGNLKTKGMWPIWPAAAGALSIHDLLSSLSTLEIPVVQPDEDEAYSSSSGGVRAGYCNACYEGQVLSNCPHQTWGSLSPRQSPSHFPTSPSPPTTLTAFMLSNPLGNLCTGVCLDCLKGTPVCREPHPDAWSEYQAGLKKYFGEKKRWIEHENNSESPE